MKIILIGAYGRLGRRIVAVADTYHMITKIGRGQKIDSFLLDADVILDVSTPEALEENLPKIVQAKKPLVIGSTGHNERQKKLIAEASQKIPLLYTSNFAPGIQLLKQLLPHLPPGNYELIDNHHAAKKDAPSGTALDLASLLPTPPTHSSIRHGDTLGEHTLILHLPFERLEIKHTALSRDLFALGALQACKQLLKKADE